MLWAAPRQQLHNTKLFDWSHFLMQQLRSKASGSTLWETAQGFYGSPISFVRLHIVHARGKPMLMHVQHTISVLVHMFWLSEMCYFYQKLNWIA